MPVIIEFNPVDLVIKAFDHLYPEIKVLLSWADNVYDMSGYPTSLLVPDEIHPNIDPIILIDSKCPMDLTINELIHQLAHVGLGGFEDEANQEHGTEWQEIANKLAKDYAQLVVLVTNTLPSLQGNSLPN